jgi:dynactin 1
MPHISDARSAKSSFQLVTVMSFIRKIAAATVAKDRGLGPSPWDALGDSIAVLIRECGQLLPLAMEAENVVKGVFGRIFPTGFYSDVLVPVSGTAPWVSRIADIKASTAVNVEAEEKLAHLNDEMQGLVRTLKGKEQAIQESVVRIELMERRMEAVKKQADTIADLEGELSNTKKQKRVYEEAMEQLQADLDALEQDNAKLKAMANAQERQGTWFGLPVCVVYG